MVTGAMRTVLWVLGSLAVVWLILGLTSLPAMGRMMQSGMMQDGMMGNGAADGGMMGMMGMMVVQLLAMFGLVGVFIYLVVDSFRSRGASRSTSASS